MPKITLKIIGALLLTFIPFAISDNISSLVQAEAGIQKTLNKYCIDCHDDEDSKGNVRLDNFSTIKDSLKFETLNHIEEQTYLKLMPPEDKKRQPSEAERKNLLSMIKNWYEQKSTTSKFRKRLKSPRYGNYVNHEDLFSGKFKHLEPFTYDRHWLLSEFIFSNKVNELYSQKPTTIDGKARNLKGAPIYKSVANPFKLPETSGVRYYASEELSSSHFMSMLGNSNIIAERMVTIAKDNPSYLPVIHSLTKAKVKHGNIISSRKEFLQNSIDKVCERIYKVKDASYLPTYTKAKIEGKILKIGEKGKHGKDGSYGRKTNNSHYFVAMHKVNGKAKTDLELLRMCERYWVNWGLSKLVVSSRLNEMRTRIAYLKIDKRKPKLKQYKPLEKSEMDTITSTIKKVRKKGMTYPQIIQKCIYEWKSKFERERNQAEPISNATISKALNEIYPKLLHRLPSQKEINKKTDMFHANKEKVGDEAAIKMLIESVVLNPEYILRSEVGTGKADANGRKMLSPRDASYAIAYALTDSKPDGELAKAAQEGRLNTKEDYKREVMRLLKKRNEYSIVDQVANSAKGIGSYTNLPIRTLRFFREFFGYHNTLKVFKDDKRFGNKLKQNREKLITEADLLVEYILKKDKNVLKELLTTENFYIYHNGNNNQTLKDAQKIQKLYEYFNKLKWQTFTKTDMKKHDNFLKSVKLNKIIKKDPKQLQKIMTNLTGRFKSGIKYTAPYVAVKFSNIGNMTGSNVGEFYGINLEKMDYDPIQPAKVQNRKGILTHPAWLQTYSQNTHTDPVTRGKWVREKLLAGTIPEVPIGVEAVIPEHPDKTIRQRLGSVTGVKECWKCHKLMNPLGNAFEMYDDFGRYRTEEELEHPKNVLNKAAEQKVMRMRRGHFRYLHKTAPMDSSGALDGTGDKKLDGKVKNAIDLIERLGQSERVRQSIIRHAFRYFMGRNEVLSDSKTLIEADQAYLKSGGSFDAVIVSLLTSDSFIYRKKSEE